MHSCARAPTAEAVRGGAWWWRSCLLVARSQRRELLAHEEQAACWFHGRWHAPEHERSSASLWAEAEGVEGLAFITRGRHSSEVRGFCEG